MGQILIARYEAASYPWPVIKTKPCSHSVSENAEGGGASGMVPWMGGACLASLLPGIENVLKTCLSFSSVRFSGNTTCQPSASSVLNWEETWGIRAGSSYLLAHLDTCAVTRHITRPRGSGYETLIILPRGTLRLVNTWELPVYHILTGARAKSSGRTCSWSDGEGRQATRTIK